MQRRIVASCSDRTSLMNSCTSSFDRGSSPVVGSSSSSRTGLVSSARASATFCCMPARQVLHRLGPPLLGEADPLEDARDLVLRVGRGHAVEARRVAEVLGGGHLLEEARLDRDAVDEPLHGALLGEHVVPEHPGAAAVVQQQRRQQADERRLARSVLAEDRDALSSLHGEADVPQRGHALVATPVLRLNLLSSGFRRLRRRNSLRRSRTSTAGTLDGTCDMRLLLPKRQPRACNDRASRGGPRQRRS